MFRITGVPKPGSGILYLPPNNPDAAYIFTARHCVEGVEKSGIQLESVSRYGGESTFRYVMLNDEDHTVLYPEEPKKDLAIIIFPRNNIRAVAGELSQLRLLSERFDFEQCKCIGFPAANKSELKTLAGKFRNFQPAYPWRFEVNIAGDENLETLESDSYAAVMGMSGGGVFFRYKDQLFLFGVMAEFKSVYKDFECVSLQTASELLETNGLPALPFTYGSPYGLNPVWFERHIGQSIQDLGDRYTQELPSFDLSVGQLFVAIERGPSFVEKVRAAYHQFLRALNENQGYLKQEFLQLSRQHVAEKLPFFKEHFRVTDWTVAGISVNNVIFRRVESLLETLVDADNLFNQESLKRYEERSKEKERSKYFHSRTYENERYHFRKILRATEDFENFLKGEFFSLALSPFLLVTGKAGYGKSHLLGDVAKKRWENGLPTILILGNKLISRVSPWEQILKELNFEGSKEALLTILDRIGQHLGERVLIMIDALNEGDGKFFWKDYLSGFIEEVSRYPYLGLVLSVRTTYLHSIVPEHILTGKQIWQYEHRGFAGIELSAVKHFARYFNLEEPQIPLLSPEFANPQFLLLLCRGLRSKGLTRIPDGLNGITAVYESFTEAINLKLIQSGYDHTPAFNLVKDVLGFFCEKFLETGKWEFTHPQGLDIFSSYNRCCDGIRLFSDLIREGVFSEERTYDFDEKEHIDVVRFTFERFGHHIQVGTVLAKYCREGHPGILFAENGFYAQQYQEYNYLDEGVLEALAVQLPEKQGVELFEVIPADFGGEDWKKKQIDENVAVAFVESLFWRKKESIDFKKCQKYVNSVVLASRKSKNCFLSTTLSLAPLPGHPFNADTLHRMLVNVTMPMRDSWWSQQVGHHFREEASPVSRLVEWVLSQDSIPRLSHEAIRLSALTLGWFLTTSHQPLRDSATLALVKLLDKNIDALIATLKAFEAADDLYVQERLFAVAYGCAMRTKDQVGLAELAQYVYDQVFKKGNPPAHILLREYAQGVVEVALFRTLNIKVSVKKVRPPYSSCLPEQFPAEKEVRKYKVPEESSKFKENKVIFGAQNTISSSVLLWDFNSYVVVPAISKFCLIKLNDKIFFDSFRKRLSKNLKKLLIQFENSLIHREFMYSVKEKSLNDEERMKIIVDFCQRLESGIEGLLENKQKEEFKNRVAPYLISIAKSSSSQSDEMDCHAIARWILQRVFELGWSPELHGSFDHSNLDSERFHHRYGGRTERIGKKYQWIAFHEILARLADNHLIKNSWNEKPKSYNSLLEDIDFIRDIDPSLPIIFSKKVFDKKIPLEKAAFTNWQTEDWFLRSDDLPNFPAFLSQKDEKGQNWIALQRFKTWMAPDKLGVRRFDADYKKIWFQLRGYLIKKSDFPSCYTWLQQQRFMGRRMPEAPEHYRIFHEEFYWSPAYKFWEKEADHDGYEIWRQFQGSQHQGIVPVESFSAGGGSFPIQEGIGFLKLCAYMAREMNLYHGEEPGYMVDKDGNLVCHDDPLSQGIKLFILKDRLLEFLERNNLVLCWTLSGEKLWRQDDPINRYRRLEINGVYYLTSDGNINGDFRTEAMDD